MESLQNGRLEFGKGQPIYSVDRVLLHKLGSGLSPSCSAPYHQSWGCCGQPAPGLISEICCNSLILAWRRALPSLEGCMPSPAALRSASDRNKMVSPLLLTS